MGLTGKITREATVNSWCDSTVRQYAGVYNCRTSQACLRGLVEIVGVFLNYEAAVDAQEVEGRSALWFSSRNRRLKCVELLLRQAPTLTCRTSMTAHP